MAGMEGGGSLRKAVANQRFAPVGAEASVVENGGGRGGGPGPYRVLWGNLLPHGIRPFCASVQNSTQPDLTFINSPNQKAPM